MDKADAAPKVDRLIAAKGKGPMYDAAKKMYIQKFGKAKFAISTFDIKPKLNPVKSPAAKKISYGKKPSLQSQPLQYKQTTGPKTPVIKTGGTHGDRIRAQADRLSK